MSAEDGAAVHFEGNKLDISVIKEDTSGERIKDARNQESLEAVLVKRFAHTNAYRDTDGRHNRISDSSEPFFET